MSDYQSQLQQLGGVPGSLEDLERAEIEEDLRNQGVDTSVDEVIGTFGLFETMEPPDEFGPAPSPALGPDWRYEPEPGEEGLFPPEG